jgi:hypothetical protein
MKDNGYALDKNNLLYNVEKKEKFIFFPTNLSRTETIANSNHLHKFCGHIQFIYLVGPTKCLTQLPTCMVTIVYISYLCTYDTITLGTIPESPRLLDLLWFLSFFFLQDHLQSMGCVAGVEGSVGESQSHWFTFLKENDDLEAHNWHCWEGTKRGSCAHSKGSGFHGDEMSL